MSQKIILFLHTATIIWYNIFMKKKTQSNKTPTARSNIDYSICKSYLLTYNLYELYEYGQIDRNIIPDGVPDNKVLDKQNTLI